MKKRDLSIGAALVLSVAIISPILYHTNASGNSNVSEDSSASVIKSSNAKVSANAKTINFDANYITFPDANALDVAADLILIGTPTQNFEEREHRTTYFDDGTVQDFYTLTDIQVEKVIKSNDSFELDSTGHLKVLEPIGYLKPETKETKVTRENYEELESGEKYIIFLKKNAEGTYAVINLNLGKFDLNSTTKLQSASSEEEKKYEEFKASVIDKYNLADYE